MNKILTDMPEIPGLYKIIAEETNGDWEFVAITKQNNLLVVHDAHIGIHPLTGYHHGLTNLHWQHIA